MWKFVGDKVGLEPIPGLPLEAEDSDFESAVELYESQFGDEGKGSIKKSGLYEHIGGRQQAVRPTQEVVSDAHDS